MANFDVTLSTMTETATNVRTQTENFRTAVEELIAATDELTTSSEGWMSEGSEIFAENAHAMRDWFEQMCGILDEYAAALDQSRDAYQEADETSAKQFKV